MKKNMLFVFSLMSIVLNTFAQVSGNIVTQYGRYTDLTTTSPLQEALGLGNFTLGVGNLPLARLHINTFRMGESSNNLLEPFSEGFLFRTDGDQSITNQWDLWTGTSATSQSERFRLYSDAGNSPFIALRSLSNGLRFETGGSNIRMRINGNQTSAINGFTINNSGFTCLANDQSFWSGAVAAPYSLLHLAGSGANTQELGYRPWMIDGITFTGNSDMSFVGPRVIAPDITEFAIAWSDNTSSGTGPDDFVVRFTNGDGTAASGAASNEGLELMRFAAESEGRVGVGDEFGVTAGTRPERRLHVHDPGMNNLTDSQLRISQDFNFNYTDLRSTSLGNLFINMTGSQQRVGIEEQNPIERLDVNGNLRLQNIPLIAPNCVLLGQNINFGISNDNRVTRLDMTYNPNDYLGGDGAWHSIGASGCDWNLVTNGTSDDLVMGYAGACNEGNVGIGVNAPTARLDILQNQLASTNDAVGVSELMIGGQATNTGNYLEVIVPVFTGSTTSYGNHTVLTGGPSKNFAGFFDCASSTNGTEAVGCYGVAIHEVGTSLNTGVRGDAVHGIGNVGIYGDTQATEENYGSIGVYGHAFGSVDYPQNEYHVIMGVQGNAEVGSPGNEHCGFTAIGVWGRVSNDVEEMCTGDLRLAGMFSGDVQVAGDLTASGLVTWSDQTLKNNIEALPSQLDNIMQLNPVSYYWNQEADSSLRLDSHVHKGFLAQQVQEIFPDAVAEIHTPGILDEHGFQIEEGNTYLGIRYEEIIPVAVKAIQELYTTVQLQNALINDLQVELRACCPIFETANSKRQITVSDTESDRITLKDMQSIVLQQNVPNPMDETTMINYKIDVDFIIAEIIFYDNNGRQINSHKILSKGEGHLNVFADDLSSGVYSYVLVVDGQIIDTKRMLKQ